MFSSFVAYPMFQMTMDVWCQVGKTIMDENLNQFLLPEEVDEEDEINN